jgi:CubicO group peptidase (beta-lactamase class C family)
MLEPDSVARATEVLSHGNDCVIGQPLSFGLGFALQPTFGPVPGPHTFGHSGAGGSVAFADPDAGVTFAYVMNQMRLSMSEQDPRSQGLIDAVYASCHDGA